MCFPTNEIVIHNVTDNEWIQSFIGTYLTDQLSEQECSHDYTNDDHEDTTGSSAKYSEKGLVLWTFDDVLITKGYKRWKQVVLFNNGEVKLIDHSSIEGTVRSSFEGHCDFNTHNAMARNLTAEELEKCKEKIAEKLLAAAKKEKIFEYHTLNENWDNPLAHITIAEKDMLQGLAEADKKILSPQNSFG